MSDKYREGREYVVCPECGSHILLDSDRERPSTWRRLGYGASEALGFRCDWDQCLADFRATVLRPLFQPESGPWQWSGCSGVGGTLAVSRGDGFDLAFESGAAFGRNQFEACTAADAEGAT